MGQSIEKGEGVEAGRGPLVEMAVNGKTQPPSMPGDSDSFCFQPPSSVALYLTVFTHWPLRMGILVV